MDCFVKATGVTSKQLLLLSWIISGITREGWSQEATQLVTSRRMRRRRRSLLLLPAVTSQGRVS